MGGILFLPALYPIWFWSSKRNIKEFSNLLNNCCLDCWYCIVSLHLHFVSMVCFIIHLPVLVSYFSAHEVWLAMLAWMQCTFTHPIVPDGSKSFFPHCVKGIGLSLIFFNCLSSTDMHYPDNPEPVTIWTELLPWLDLTTDLASNVIRLLLSKPLIFASGNVVCLGSKTICLACFIPLQCLRRVVHPV